MDASILSARAQQDARQGSGFINIIGRRFDLSRETRAYIKRRVETRMSRFRPRLRGLDIRITDINGPRGGVDKSCSVVATLNSGEELVARTEGNTVQDALTRAVQVMGRSIANKLKRNRWRRRPKGNG